MDDRSLPEETAAYSVIEDHCESEHHRHCNIDGFCRLASTVLADLRLTVLSVVSRQVKCLEIHDIHFQKDIDCRTVQYVVYPAPAVDNRKSKPFFRSESKFSAFQWAPNVA